jgi:hypothetical protein
MNFDRRIRFIRVNDKHETEYLDLTPTHLPGWKVLDDSTTMPPTIWVDEAVGNWMRDEPDTQAGGK